MYEWNLIAVDFVKKIIFQGDFFQFGIFYNSYFENLN